MKVILTVVALLMLVGCSDQPRPQEIDFEILKCTFADSARDKFALADIQESINEELLKPPSTERNHVVERLEKRQAEVRSQDLAELEKKP